MLKINIIPALQDNYVYFLEDEKTGKTAVVDPSEAQPVLDFMKDHKKAKLDYILNTHHHGDHIGGNKELKEKFGGEIVAFKGDAHRIKNIDIMVEEGSDFKIGESAADIYEVPGHTLGHIAFHFPSSMALFCGDTLFSLGCGRLFEGTAKQMWESLKKLRSLPDNTQVYCGHEYTYANGNFCLIMEPENGALHRRLIGVKRLRDAGKPSIPSMMGIEKKTNVFLRADQPDLLANVPLAKQDPVSVFAYLREQKDNF